MKILRRSTYPQQQLQSSRTLEKFSVSSVLSDAFELKDLFIHHELLEPGKRSSSPHFHLRSDEFIFVLKGEATVHAAAEREVLKAGDCACFKAASGHTLGAPHFVANESQTDIEFLVISQRNDPADVILA